MTNGHIWVREPEGRRLTVPAWMTDKWFCETIREGESPVCSVTALAELRDLLKQIIAKQEDE